MIITHVIPYMHPNAGGPPVVVDRLCRGLMARGWNVRVVTTDSMAERGDDAWQASFREQYPLDVHKTGRMRSYAYSKTLAAALRTAAHESDLVHLHTLWTYPTLAAARVCRKLQTPYVVMPHGMSDPHSLRRSWLRKRIYGFLCEWPYVRRAQAMIYTHTEERRLAEEAVGGLPPGHIVPLGADDPPAEGREVLAEQFLRDYPHLRGRNLVIFLGRLHPKKGLDLLIPAFAEVVCADPSAHLVLVGPGDESYLQSVREMITRHALNEKVLFTGPLAAHAKWQALAASTAFALPSYQENFALTVVEALRMGVPVVLSRRVNIWEDVTKAGAGLACDLSVSSVSQSILAYLKDQNLRESSAVRGPQLVADQFNWERSVDAMEAVYAQLLPQKVVSKA